MEIIGRIISQSPLQTVETRNREGKTEMLSILGFELQSGSDRLYAEMLQEQARRQATLDYNHLYKACLKPGVHTWTDQGGQERYETRVTLQSITLM